MVSDTSQNCAVDECGMGGKHGIRDCAAEAVAEQDYGFWGRGGEMSRASEGDELGEGGDLEGDLGLVA